MFGCGGCGTGLVRQALRSVASSLRTLDVHRHGSQEAKPVRITKIDLVPHATARHRLRAGQGRRGQALPWILACLVVAGLLVAVLLLEVL